MKTEKIFAGLFLLGCVFKLMHWPGASIALILSCGIMSILYFPFGFYFLSGKTFQQQNIGLSVSVGVGLSTAITGIIFKLMQWPGAFVMLLLGVLTTAPLFFVVRSMQKKNELEELNIYYKQLLIRLSIIGTLSLILFLISSTQQRFIMH